MKPCVVDDDPIADSTRFLVRSLASGPNLLILDLRMPGMDGLELQRYLTSVNKRIPIIFVSARADEEDRIQAMPVMLVETVLGATPKTFTSSA
jgi:CheY-like chemotaxis protein